MSKDLGRSTAYGYAVSKGYTGTEEEFAELMASYAHVAEDARASAETASNAKDDAVSAKNTAVTSAQTASAKASEAAQSAQNASTSASTASTKASEASASASNAQTSASTASTKATEAASSATSANSAKTDAVNAKNAAQTAQTASETARTAAEEAQASAEQAAQEAHDTLDKKADIDGYYEEMTVGDAEQLVSSQFVTDSVPYLYRTIGGSADVGNREYMESIVGGTVAWNQLVQNGDFANGTEGWTGYNGDLTVGNGTLIWTMTTEGTSNQSNCIRAYANVTANHIYMLSSAVKCSNASAIILVSRATTSDTWWRGEVNPTDWKSVKTLIKPTANGEQFTFRYSNVQAVGQIGDTITIDKTMLIDLTQMFGSTIADYIYSLEQATAGAGVAWFKKYFPLDYYEYDAGTLKHVEGLTSHDMVGFNQLPKATTVTKDGVTFTVNGDGTIDTSGTTSASKTYVLANVNLIKGNRYQLTGCPTGGGSGKYGLALADLSGNTLVNDFGRGAFYTPTANETVRVVLRYWYNFSLNNKTFSPCLHLVWSGWRNGEYEPYQKHSYPLDSSLVLRGIPKLDAQNNLYYDGDVYNHDGTVERRFGIVDLGTLNWSYSSASTPKYFSAPLVTAKTQGANMRCPIYQKIATSWSNFTASSDKTMYVGTNKSIYIHDESYTSVADFKAAMSGVYLLYELATPTTEEAEPFQEVQICDDFGTEEFVSTSIVPVGHNTEYPANLRDKLQHLPNLADADGYYMIKQVNKQMSLEHFRIPKAPTEDGTYTLKATVSGGTPTYTWESETVENG